MRNLKNKILFFGGSGRLGKYWIPSLLKKNIVYAVINKEPINIKNKNFHKISLNKIIKIENLINFCDLKNINIIVNCAALTNIKKCEEQKIKALNLNFQLVKKFYKISNTKNIKIVQISTDMVYGNKINGKNFENTKPYPLNYYSDTKLKADKVLIKVKTNLIVRTNFFGEGTKKNKTFSDEIIYKKKKISLWNNVFFTPVYLGVLVDILSHLINFECKGIYHVSSNECISKYDLGKKILKKFNLKKTLIAKKFDNDIFINRPLNMCLSNSKLLKKFPKFKKKLNIDYQLDSYNRDIAKK